MNRYDIDARCTQPKESVKLNQLRLVCNDSDRKGLHVKSNFDETYRLDGKTDESISFTDNTLVVIQNKLERSCEILLESIVLPDGRQLICKPSRQTYFKLVAKEVSKVRSEHDLILGPGESCVIHSSLWAPQEGRGAVFPV